MGDVRSLLNIPVNILQLEKPMDSNDEKENKVIKRDRWMKRGWLHTDTFAASKIDKL